MNCGNCHQPLEAGAQFCGNCGTPVLQTPAPATPASVSSTVPLAPSSAAPVAPGAQQSPMNPIQNQFAAVPNAQDIPSHMTFSIIVTIFCSQLLGIIAIIYSSKVKGLVAQGKIEEAQKASKTAKTLDIVAVCLAVPITILYVLLQTSGT